jgi:hypothetical protein
MIPDGSATAKAIDYSLNRWQALTRYIDDGDLPIDNRWVENQIRPIALGRNNWLFAGSLRTGKRAAAVMSLVHSARLNDHDPYGYLRDMLERLPTHSASKIEELLPHRGRLRQQQPDGLPVVKGRVSPVRKWIRPSVCSFSFYEARKVKIGTRTFGLEWRFGL